MKIHNIKPGVLAIMVAATIGACKKKVDVGILDTGNFTETTMPLKDAAGFPVGAAISLNPFLNDAGYSGIVQRDFDGVTFEYEMKHAAIVQDNGTLNFTNADALVNAVGAQEIFGHTLAWHQNQNANYLKSHAGITLPAPVELNQNGGFEAGDAGTLANWNIYNSGNPAGTSTITAGSGSNEVLSGSRSMKVINPTAYPGSQWRVQVASDVMNVTSGKQYKFSYWVKAASAGGSIRLSSQYADGGSAQYQGDQNIGTDWQQISWTITANTSQVRVLFDMGQAANTYYIDDASFAEVIAAPTGPEVAAKLEDALETFITGMVNRYKGKVKAWDVVNEPLNNEGFLRTTANSTDIQNIGQRTDLLMWTDYLGMDYLLKAFEFAEAADPAADLYINEFGLETSAAKTDSLIKLVAQLKDQGAKIDGIGTQMHISWNTNRAGIESMFRKLGATGLKIRISELDIKTVLSSAAKAPTPLLLGYQADMMKFVVAMYMKHVPPAQRAGITIWGVTDQSSWLYDNGTEYPLIYDNEYNKKPAYGGFLLGLQGN